jgi:DNA-binding CsgD family transcriptional regulator/N-acetylneuraminic acid mutarotase
MVNESPLTRRETEILGLIAQGLSNDEIAQQLSISPNTVKVHIRNIFEKMAVQSRTEATIEAVKRGWVAVPGISVGQEQPPPAWPPLTERLSPWLWLALGGAFLLAVLMAFWPVRTFYARTEAPAFTTDSALPVSLPTSREDVARWSTFSPMPTARSRAAAALLDEGWHVVGGEDASGDLDVHEVYVPKRDQWRTLPPRPVAARGAGAAGLGQRLYVAGGCSGAAALTQVDVFDVDAGAWRSAAALPAPRCGLAMVAWQGKLYAFGGWDGAQTSDSLFIFDPETNRWQEGAKLPAPRAFASATAQEDAIYLLGGNDGSEQRAEMWRYLPAGDVWEPAPALPQACSGLSVASDMGSLYVISGGEGVDAYPHFRFDFASLSWSTIDAPRRGPWHHAVAAMIGPNMHIAGGWGGDYLAGHEVYQASYLLFLPAQQGQ